ncbi:hypothetical protein KY290_010939 [Solanum tuberosum]|uniref:Chromo domain-containing protein n=1 Tax=Solanum tuberosum TaxID=4113 RepID=A0ABQ7VZ72_SOLTU|nr:hypothetical protein KY290_010939 [Solanum tuberosum]
MTSILQKLIAEQQSDDNYNLKNGCLLYKGRLVLPKGSSRIPGLLNEFHSSPIGGHSGYLRTYKRLFENIYWEGMKRDVQDFVARCEIYQKNKSQTLSPVGLLQPLPIPHHVWEDQEKILRNGPTGYLGLSIGMTPFKALYGRDPSSIFHMDDTTSAVEEVNEQVRTKNLILTKLNEHLLQAQQRMKNQADRHRRELTFEIGELVYLKLRAYKLRSLAKKINEKLSPRFYELELQVEPEAARQIGKLINGKLEVLIKWKNLSEFENTWEEYAIIDQQFPDFYLEDKVILIGKGNDVPQVIKTYSRRPK